MSRSMIKTYSDLIKISGFVERFEYVKFTNGQKPFDRTFGGDRYLNQSFYSSTEWLRVRRKVILRDNGFDLGDPDRPIGGRIIVHHLNPLTLDVLERCPEMALDPENLISVSNNTHEAIHYGCEHIIFKGLVERRPNDQCPWKKGG